ncbi:MAG TPA: hypothetical protein VK468_06535, partial [Pyrinomonadaceae bacterium]|nr:hypothetical protein [Pyrinomonadaceae bacterium]
MRRGIFIPILIFLLPLCVHAQDLPAKIRGYRVYNAQISINGNSGSDAVVSIGEPTVTDVS